MDLPSLFTFIFHCCFLLTAAGLGCHGSTHRRETDEIYDNAFRPTKLFVFGDSYGDTGNVRKSFRLGNSWNVPYGFTFPGKPAGRFSDGRVLTDYFAKLLGLKSPLAYEWMKFGGKKLRNGMNFAYGGSGVFDTPDNVLPNMTTQIDLFEKIIKTNRSVYNKLDLESSAVLVCLSGNDYSTYIAKNNTPEGLPSFIPRVINQLVMNLKRVHGLGPTKIAVTALQPLGCLPGMTQTSSFQQCNATLNLLVNDHNLRLQQSVAKLNNETNSSTFFVLDLYTSFTTVLIQKGDDQGKLKFETPLKPCCMGINNGYSCGSVNEKGEKMYTVCSDPKTSFFWDSSHPTESGWRAVYTMLSRAGLKQFFNSSRIVA